MYLIQNKKSRQMPGFFISIRYDVNLLEVYGRTVSPIK